MEYPWFGEYDLSGMPRTLKPYPRNPSHYFLDYAALKYPELIIAQPDIEVGYAEIKEHSDRLAYALVELGVQKGDRIATMLPTSVQFVLVDAGISKAGAVHVPCSFLEARQSIMKKIVSTDAKAFIYLDDYSDKAQYLLINGWKGLLIGTNLFDYSRDWARPVSIKGAQRLLELIEHSKPKPPKIFFDTAKDLEAIIFTGGTTGIPKGCMLTHRNVVANAVQNPVIFGPLTGMFEGNMSVLMGNPFFHSYGHSVMHTMINCCFNLILLVDPRDYETLLKFVEKYSPVLQTGVPTQFMSMLSREARKVKVVGISGSAPLPPKVQKEFSESAPGRYLVEGYGLSELTAVTHCNISSTISAMGGRRMIRFFRRSLLSPKGIAFMRKFAKRIGPKAFAKQFLAVASIIRKISNMLSAKQRVERFASIGVPLPDTEIKVVDVESGKPYSFDQLKSGRYVGEMLVKGPQRMLGYWPEPGSGIDEEGFIHTGDIVRMDENGYFFIVDRIKDMVVISGYKVYTREIDDILYAHPATEHAAAIGIPDPERPGSERVAVFVQLKEDYKNRITEKEYLEFLRERVARYAVPTTVIFIDEMPLTPMLKVNKRALRDFAARVKPEVGGGDRG